MYSFTKTNPFAIKEFTTYEGTWRYEFWELFETPQSADPVKPDNEIAKASILKNPAITQIVGRNSFDMKKPILHTQEKFTIRDDNSLFYDLLQNQPATKFRLDIYLNEDLENRLNISSKINDIELTTFTNELDLVAYDGLKMLSSIPYEQTGYLTLTEFFKDCLDKTNHNLDIKIKADLQHLGAIAGPSKIRIPVDQVLRGDANKNYFDVLESVLKRFSLYLVQSAGDWWIQHIHLKDSETTIYTIPYTGSESATFGPHLEVSVSTPKKRSYITAFNALSPINITHEFIQDNAGMIEDAEFEDWNGSTLTKWELLSGSYSSLQTGPKRGFRADTGVRIQQRTGRIFKGNENVSIVITGDYVTQGSSSVNEFSLQIARIKLVDIAGGSDYWLEWDNGFNAYSGIRSISIDATIFPDQPAFELNDLITLPSGFIGYIEAEIYIPTSEFDPDDDSTNEIDYVYIDQFSIDDFQYENYNSVIFNYSNEFSSNQQDLGFTFGDYVGRNYSDCIQYLDDAKGVWLPTYSWDATEKDVYLSRKQAMIIQDSFAAPHNGYQFTIDRSESAIHPHNSLLYTGGHYNPFYIKHNKYDGMASVKLFKLNSFNSDPDERLHFRED